MSRMIRKNNGVPFRARSKQHRQDAEKHVVADDDVGREVPQHLLQALVLSGNGIDEHALHRDAQPFRPLRHALQFGHHGGDISQVNIRARGKGAESCSDALDALTQSGAGQADDLVAFRDQDTPNREQRIEMACRGRRSDENFHSIHSL